MPRAHAPLAVRRSLALLALAATALAACGDKLHTDAAPVLSFDPDPPQWQFQKVRPAEFPHGIDKEVTVSNDGEGTLKLANFDPAFSDDYDLFYYRNGDTTNQITAVLDGQNKLKSESNDLLSIPAHEDITFVLNYQPKVEGSASGVFRFITNDPNHHDAEIEIVSESGAPEIRVAPPSIDFGRVATGDEAPIQTVAVTNIGQLVLTIDGTTVSGNGFKALLGDQDLADHQDLLADPDQDGTPGLSPGKSFEIGVQFKNIIDGPATGVLSIASNDPRTSRVDVDLKANGASPCIRVTPAGEDGLMFGAVPINGNLKKPFTIESCGGQPLRLDSIAMTADSDSAITLDESTVPGLPALMPAMVVGEALPNRNIRLQCSPTEARAYGGWVEIKSNDELNPVVKVRVTCSGILNSCPRPAVVQDSFNVAPLDSVVLDATPSTDEDGPAGQPVEYSWEVVEQPDGANSRAVERLSGDPQAPLVGALEDDKTTPRAVFFVPVVGTYTLKLHVKDNLGQDAPSELCSEPVAIVTITAESNEDIHVEMSWDTPSDRNQDDLNGSDVDLHMLHPRGNDWGQSPYDCYYANPTPDWGVRGNPADDPTLDLDDVDGHGPENITLDDPEDTSALGQPYRVGVDYYRAEHQDSLQSWGPSFITVKIYLGGQLAWENQEPKELPSTHDLWEVAQIIWAPNDHRVRVVNLVHPI